MRSTNFEFMREHRPDLADEAAAIEGLVHLGKPQAANLLCSFGEKVLQLFVIENGGRVNRADSPVDGKTVEFGELVRRCEKESQPWHVPEAQRQILNRLLSEGNKAKHRLNYQQTVDAIELLQSAWSVAGWVWEQLQWGNPAERFAEPPKGGRELDAARRQSVEALKLVAEANRSCDVSGWICDDQRNIVAPADFVGRDFVFDEMKKFLSHSDRRVLIIQGEPGRGKTAIIQRFLAEELPAGITPFVFYFRDQQSQAAPQRWVRHLYASLVKRCELPLPKPSIRDDKPEDLVQHLQNRIQEAVEKYPNKRMLFVIDSVDEAGPAEKLVWAFLDSPFPNTVQVIATTRPKHSSELPNFADRQSPIQPLDLDGPDYRINHQNDARKFLSVRMRDLDRASIEKVVQLSDGNFLVLQGICRELREGAVPSITLSELSELKANGKDLAPELYERTWKRLKRLPVDELDRVETLARLLVCAIEPLSKRMIRDVLKLRNADWVKVQQQFEQYIVQSDRHPLLNDELLETNAGGGLKENTQSFQVFRLFHQTFVKFVRGNLQDDIADTETRLADYCLEQIGKRKAGYEYEYALRFGPTHLCRAKKWLELEALLTDLEFVEQKCRLGMVRSLIADYQQASQDHPEWANASENERRRRVLADWSAGVMSVGRQWSDDVRRAWNSEDRIGAQRNIAKPSFPIPPDTSDLCHVLRGERSEELQVAHAWTESVKNLESYRTFVTRLADILEQHPESVLACAANCRAPGRLAEDAEELLRQGGTTWIEERPRLDLSVGMIPLPTIHTKATAFTISADGMYAATGDTNGDLQLWDLETGECLHDWQREHQSEVTRVALSVDGSRLISAGINGSIRVHDCRKPYRQLSGMELECEVVDLDCSPEGSIIAVACRDNTIRILDRASDQLVALVHVLTSTELGEVVWARCSPEVLVVLAGDVEHNCSGWTLVTGNHVTFPNKVESVAHGQFLRVGDAVHSADRRIALHKDHRSICVDGEPINKYHLGNEPTFKRLVADGRVVWGCDPGMIIGMDLLTNEEVEEIVGRTKWSDPAQSDPENEFNMATYSDAIFGTASRVLISRLVETPPADETWALIQGGYSVVAYTPDYRISIEVAREDAIPSDALHRLPLPEDAKIGFIQISPCGQRAFISLASHWIVWNIRTGEQISSHPHDDSDASVVMPDWKCAASISDGCLKLVDLSTGEAILDTQLGSSGHLYVTPDGRRLIVIGADGKNLWSVSGGKLVRGEFPALGCSTVLVSPDGGFLFCDQNDRIEVYDLENGRKLASQPCLRDPSYWGRYSDNGEFWMDVDGTIVADFFDGNTAFRQQNEYELQLKIRTPSRYHQCKTPIVTPVRVFRYDTDDEAIRSALYNDQPLPGHADLHPTVACPHCGKRSRVPEAAEQAIDATIYLEGLPSPLLPCLHLPNEAWNDPLLQCRCEHCKEPLRLNPFVVFVR